HPLSEAGFRLRRGPRGRANLMPFPERGPGGRRGLHLLWARPIATEGFVWHVLHLIASCALHGVPRHDRRARRRHTGERVPFNIAHRQVANARFGRIERLVEWLTFVPDSRVSTRVDRAHAP